MTTKSMQTEVADVISERGATYGDFAIISDMTQKLKAVLKTQHKYEYMPPHMKEALEMICHKMARIMVGDHNYRDSWVDISGYAQLPLKYLKEPGGTMAPPPSFVCPPSTGPAPREGAQTPPPARPGDEYEYGATFAVQGRGIEDPAPMYRPLSMP